MTLAERISSTEKKLSQLRLQHRRKEAAARAESAKKERANDTRRKILAGAVALADPVLCGMVMESLAKRLDRPDDRALFGFLGQQGSSYGDAGSNASEWPGQPAGQHGGPSDFGNQHGGQVV